LKIIFFNIINYIYNNRVQRTVQSSSSSSSNKSVVKGSSLDQALNAIKGPKVVSTVAKSSYDWDTFKVEEGLEDDLSVAAKDGYLTRKDFLNRCDTRKFEIEKEERQRNATATMNTTSTGL
jgi:hypothetical protein